MKNINKITLLFLILILFFGNLSYSQRIYDRFDNWLKLVNYIITPTEKKIFLSLKSDIDKKNFIKLFWKQRDPTKGTEENEYKIEIIKRFEYVNKYFGRGTPRKGWQTDMGRLYITLGPPQKIEKFDHINGLFPAIVWDYYGLSIPGVPKNLTLTFFKRNGFGEYVMYDPATDGPAVLLDNIETSFGKYDYKKVYKKIRKLAPQLVGPAFSVVPGRHSLLPQVSNTLTLSKVLTSPLKRVNTYYADNYKKFKGIVNVKHSFNYIRKNFIYTVIKDPVLGIKFLHFSLKPKRISFEHSNKYDKYFAAVKLNVILKNKGKTVYRNNKNYSLSFDENDFTDKVKKMGVSFDDMIPIVNGKFLLTLYLENSVNNEFVFLEKKIEIKSEYQKPVMEKPFLGYRINKVKQPMIRPFQINGKVVSIDSNNTFSTKDKIFLIIPIENFEKSEKNSVIVTVKNMEGYAKYEKSYKYDSDSIKYNKSIIIDLTDKFTSAVYKIKTVLLSNKNIHVKVYKTNFTISPLSNTNHPIEMMKGINYSDKGLYYYKMASLYKNMNNFKYAYFFYEKAYKTNPKMYNEIISFLDFLLLINKPKRASTILESFKGIKELESEYNKYRGKLLYMMKNYSKALKYFQKSIKVFKEDYNLLNLAGVCYLKTSQIEKAKDSFMKSLKIYPKQPLVKKYLKDIEKR